MGSVGNKYFLRSSSYYVSHLALRKAIKQIDSKTIRTQKAGGWFSTVTAMLNAVGALLFLVGVCSITLFANANLKSKEKPIDTAQSSTANPKAASTSTVSSTKASTANTGH
jgi:hypothetical protein